MSDSPDNEAGGPVTVASYWNDAEAGMAKSLLEAHGIPAVLSSEVPHSVMPVTVNGMGEVQVRVPSSMADDAREILREIFDGTPHTDDGDAGTDDGNPGTDGGDAGTDEPA